MADVKISDLTAATSANGDMQLEVNDGGISRSITARQMLGLTWSQVGTTQNASGVDTVTFSSIGAYGQLELVTDGITINDPYPDFPYLIVEWSVDDGATYIGTVDYISNQNAITIEPRNETSYAPFVIRLGQPSEFSVANVTRCDLLFPEGSSLWPIGNTTNAVTRITAATGSKAPVLIYTSGLITNLRIRSYSVDEGGSTDTLRSMTGGTIKLYKR